MIAKLYVQLEIFKNVELKAYLDSLPSMKDDSKKKAKEIYEKTAKLVLECGNDSLEQDKIDLYTDYSCKVIHNGLLLQGKKNFDDWVACGIFPSVKSV